MHLDQHKHILPREHTPRQHMFYFNLVMLTEHSFLSCAKPLAAASSCELWLHIPLNVALMPMPSVFLLEEEQLQWSKIPR